MTKLKVVGAMVKVKSIPRFIRTPHTVCAGNMVFAKKVINTLGSK